MEDQEFHFDSPLSPEECRQKLTSALARDHGLLNLFLVRPQPFVGRVEDSAFRLRRNASHANSMAITLAGDISPAPAGSHIVGRVQKSFSLYAALLFWGIPSLAVIIPLAFLIWKYGIGGQLGLISLLGIGFILIACVANALLTLSYARRESLYFRDYLKELLRATD